MRPTTDRRPVVVIRDEVMSLAPVSPLWAVCAVPGAGPEYRFTSAAGGRLRRLVTAVRACRVHRRTARAIRRAYRVLDIRYRHVIGDRSC